MDTSGKRHRGVLAADDMARWTPRVEAPLTYDYGRYTVCKTGPWGQGPVMLQQLALLKGFDLDGLDPTSADFIHLQVECAKLAFADREAFYGDPDFVAVPTATLLSDAYNAARRKLVGEHGVDGIASRLDRRIRRGDQAVPRQRRRRRPPAPASRPSAGSAARAATPCISTSSIHAGNMVSATPSGGWLQSSPVIPELGFCLGTRAQMFWLEDGHPAALAPGKRPRTTLTPTLALRDGEPYLVCGTPGGDQQDQWITQLFLRHVHRGIRICKRRSTRRLGIPSIFPPRSGRARRAPACWWSRAACRKETVAELKRRGHIVEVGPDWSEGRLTAAARDGRRRRAAANPRGMQGYAAGR